MKPCHCPHCGEGVILYRCKHYRRMYQGRCRACNRLVIDSRRGRYALRYKNISKRM